MRWGALGMIFFACLADGRRSLLRSRQRLAASTFVAPLPADVLPKRSVPLNIYVDAELRAHLSMRNSDRKARVFLAADYIAQLEGTERSASVQALREIVEKRFAPLLRQPYVLRFLVPGLMENKRQFASDAEVHATLRRVTAAEALPSVHLYVDTLPGIFPPPAQPYLAGMADPDEAESYTLLSFYRFFEIGRPEDMAVQLEALWKPFRTVGRIYVAREGVNAQMAVPSNVLPNFQSACESLDLLRDLYLNCDHTLSRASFEASRPFKALHIRVRDQIVADGLDQPLDWHKSGREMAPLEWHEQLDNPASVVLDCRNSYESDVGLFSGANPLNTTFFRESWDALEETLRDTPKDAPIMTYCTGGIRCVKINAYLEQRMGFTNVARLQGGIISYSRELERVQRLKQQQEEGGEGGEREEEVAAAGAAAGAGEVSQAQGLSSHHLARHVQQSKFKGTNYVFDERMGARITEDVLSVCETCGAGSDAFTNCASYSCHVRFIQCGACRAGYGGCCSVYCQQELASSEAAGGDVGSGSGGESGEGGSGARARRAMRAMIPRVKAVRPSLVLEVSAEGEGEGEMGVGQGVGQRAERRAKETMAAAALNKGEGDHAEGKTEAAAPLPLQHASSMDAQLDALQTYCERLSEPEPPLLSALRAATLATFGATHARMVSGHLQGRLLAMFARLVQARRVLELGSFTGYSALCFAEGLSDGGRVLSCEIDPEALRVAREFIGQSPHGGRVDLRECRAADLIAQARREGAEPFDVVFVDADKKAYQGYLLDLMGRRTAEGEGEGEGDERCLLADGALILVDNTLWKGLVLAHDDDLAALAPEPGLYGQAARMRALAGSMHGFNAFVAAHPQLSPVILPLRDGLSAIRFSSSPTPPGAV